MNLFDDQCSTLKVFEDDMLGIGGYGSVCRGELIAPVSYIIILLEYSTARPLEVHNNFQNTFALSVVLEPQLTLVGCAGNRFR